MPSWLTIEQAAEQLGCSIRTIKRRISDGTIPVAQLGYAVRIHPDDLRALAAPRR